MAQSKRRHANKYDYNVNGKWVSGRTKPVGYRFTCPDLTLMRWEVSSMIKDGHFALGYYQYRLRSERLDGASRKTVWFDVPHDIVELLEGVELRNRTALLATFDLGWRAHPYNKGKYILAHEGKGVTL